MRKLAMTSALCLMAVPAVAQVNCFQTGNITNCDNGQTFFHIGNTSIDSNGTTYFQNGNVITTSDGRTCIVTGNVANCH